jgi:N-acetyl-S-(2-succino)cysteine monooxygenase
MTSDRKMALGLFVEGLGHHIAAWRDPGVDPRSRQSLDHFTEIALTAERGRFDFIFTADTFAMFGPDDPHQWARSTVASRHEPFTLMAALAARTERIGLVLTATTTYYEPMHVARMFASLDQLSGGRAGWNIVTSNAPAEAANFGRNAHPEAEERYARAAEFVEVVTGLWDSWDDDALVADQALGRYVDPDKLHRLNHRGAHFSVRGPLTMPRSPQGRPVLVQAGQSGPGRTLSARHGEIIFSIQPDVTQATAYRAEIRATATGLGRDHSGIKVMPGVLIVAGATRTEAEDRYARLQRLIPEDLGVSLVSGLFGVDLSSYDLDARFAGVPLDRALSHGKAIHDLALREGLTLRELYLKVAGQRGHRVVVGDARDVADDLESWFSAGACDGFNIMPPTFPGGLDAIVEHVVPELRRRGLVARDYAGRTLRDHLGLARPPSRWASA